MYFVSTNSDLHSASATVFMFAISCYIGPRYNDTRLYVVCSGGVSFLRSCSLFTRVNTLMASGFDTNTSFCFWSDTASLHKMIGRFWYIADAFYLLCLHWLIDTSINYTTSQRLAIGLSIGYIDRVKPVYNDHLMGYFSAFWSSSRWPRAT